MAQGLLAGKGYVQGDTQALTVPPLYSIFLAGVFGVFGPSVLAARIAQALLAVASYALIYLIATGVFGAEVGLVALLLSSFYPALVPWHGYLLTESFYTFTVALFFFFLYRVSRNPTWFDALACGLSLGLNLLTRENLLFFPLLLVPVVAAKLPWRQAISRAVLVLIGTALLLTPWFCRNYALTGQVVYTDRVSYVLYAVTGQGYLSPGYAAAVAGESDPPSEDRLAFLERYGQVKENLNPRFVLSQPGEFARRMLYRFVEYWFHPNGLWSLPEVFVVRASYVFGHAVLILLAILGMGDTIRRRRWSASGLVLVLLYITVLNLTTWGPHPRYNLPFLPIVFVFTAIGALLLIERFSSPRAQSVSRADS
jgi:4-amino-4-deoxy-L-arabinose transferase-like glycosyltransferase